MKYNNYYKNRYKKRKSKDKSILKKANIDNNRYIIGLLAKKYNWNYYSKDDNNYRVSFVDELRIYRADVYLSTFTIGILAIGTDKIENWHRKIDISKAEEIFKYPSLYE